ncbi:MAG: EAL domain-containing protein [Actinomycetota bacterium]|nr:EAL domain-containing protein [Actinomycetota bacterium]
MTSSPARTPRPARRIWLLATTLAILSGGLYAAVVADLRPVAAPWHLSWVVLAPLFYLAESHVVHLELRREAHSFSLGEMPMTLALFFGGPATFVLAQIVGAAGAFVFHRRQSPVKVGFNVAHYALEAVVAATVFFVVLGDEDPTSARGWIAALLAAGSSAALGEVLVAAAILLSEGELSPRELMGGIATGLVIAATNASLALVGVLLLWHDPAATWLLAVPSVVLLLAYRAYTKDRQKEERIELLRRSAAAMQDDADVAASFEAFLDHAREMFRSEGAALVLLPKAPQDPALETSLDPHGYTFMEPLGAARAGALASLVVGREARLLDERDAGEGGGTPGVRDGIVGPVFGRDGMIGTFLVLNRRGDVSTFDAEDLRLFETLAQHLGTSLEKGRLEESLAEVNEIQKDLEHRASHDALTGLPNRSLFQLRLQEAISSGDRFAVLGIDLDGFKAVNDSLGHDAGDRLLITVGERLEACLRPEDTVARLGGDEFAVLLAGTKSDDDAPTVAQRIVDDLMRPIHLGGREAFVGASVGIAVSTSDAGDAEVLMNQADAAMYSAKASGKGRFVVFEEKMLQAKQHRAVMKDRLEVALERDQFVLHFQPIFDMGDGSIWGTEALIRWDHPELGFIPPADFLSVAEETGQMVRVGEWVLREACRRLSMWRRTHGPDRVRRITVNLSRRQLLQPGLPAAVADALAAHDLPSGSIVLELNEAALMTDTDAVAARLHELQTSGARVAIDDFGTGFSSLSDLVRFPVDVLKIDQSFVRAAHEDPAKSELARAIIGLAHALGLGAVAQGVETSAERHHLRSLGCALGQGYLFARPLDPDAMEELLDRGVAVVGGAGDRS